MTNYPKDEPGLGEKEFKEAAHQASQKPWKKTQYTIRKLSSKQTYLTQEECRRNAIELVKKNSRILYYGRDASVSLDNLNTYAVQDFIKLLRGASAVSCSGPDYLVFIPPLDNPP